MPVTATIRNLGKLTSIGLLAPLSDAARTVAARLKDEELLKKGRVHPFSILLAQDTYRQGHGVKGSLTWNPVRQITDAVEAAFELSFASVEPTGKRFYLGIDCSGSMSWLSSRINNTQITAREGAACMALVTLRKERHVAGRCTTHGSQPASDRRGWRSIAVPVQRVPWVAGIVRLLINSLKIATWRSLPGSCHRSHYLTIMGSVAYGVSTYTSDFDTLGFCIPPRDVIFPHLAGVIPGFGRQIQRFEQVEADHVFDPGVDNSPNIASKSTTTEAVSSSKTTPLPGASPAN